MGNSQRFKNYLGQLLSVFASTGLIVIISTYVSFVYTEYLGISAAAVGVILSFGTIIDGVTDFGMGIIVDHTKSKYGKVRPWFRRMALPLAITMALVFLAPQSFSAQAKLIWLFVTYNVYCTMLTAVRIPATSLVSVISDCEKTRQTSSFISGLAGQVGTTVATTLVGIFVSVFGGGLIGYQLTNVLFAVVIGLSLFTSFYLIKEVNVAKEEIEAKDDKDAKKAPAKKTNLLSDMVYLVKNKYWMIQEGAELAVNVGIGFLMGTMAYFCNFVLGNMEVSMSIMSTVLSFGMLGGICFWGVFGRKFDAPKLTAFGCIMSAVGYIISTIGWWGFHSWFIVFFGLAFKQFFSGTYMITQADLTARTVVYGNWKNGVSQDGLCFSGKSVLSKICTALASAIVGFLLTGSGYVGGETPSAATVNAIAIMFLVVPIAFNFIAGIFFAMFKLTNEQVEQMSKEIAERE
jgi:glycoside/pentoside/hexuronide:cation symporter, GPH family